MDSVGSVPSRGANQGNPLCPAWPPDPVDRHKPRSVPSPALDAAVAQLVERQLPKLNVVGSSPISRSIQLMPWRERPTSAN